MKLDPHEPSDLIAILIALSPLIWLVRWAFQQKPRNYFLILGTVTILLCFSFAFFAEFLSSAMLKVLMMSILVIALASVCAGATVWGTRKKSWKLVTYFGLANVALLIMLIVLAPGNAFGPFIIVGVMFLINTMVTISLVIGQIVLTMRRAR